MQNSHLKLKEIIWEITGACKNGCDYCGSKECWNDGIDNRIIRQIVDRIVEFGDLPAIDISGGDPLLVPKATHEYIVNKLHTIKTEVKILFNPKSFDPLSPSDESRSEKLSILRLYDWIGMSINTEKELDLFYALGLHKELEGRFTVITNFNLKNVFLFDKIKQMVKDMKCAWQIQYTMYKNPKVDLSIYNDQPACDYLFKQMNDAIKEGIQIIPADDMNTGPCGAGSSSIGLLSNGDVVPCLSMRSWVDDLKELVQGNLIAMPLATIWQQGFANYRFKCFTCCKDICKKPFVLQVFTPTYILPMDDKTPDAGKPPVYLYGVFPTPSPKDHWNVVRYGVFPPDRTTVYAVRSPVVVTMYAVSVPEWDKNPPYEPVTYTSTTVSNGRAMKYGISRPRTPKKG